MRLLYVSEATGWTGGANQICLTSAALRGRGHEVSVACRAGAELGRRLAELGVPVHDLRIRQDYDLLSAGGLASIARRCRAQLIHAHHPQAHAVSLAAAWLLGRLPLVVTRRVIYPIRTNPFSLLKYRSRLVTRYIAVCRTAADALAAAGVRRPRIEVIPSAVDISRWSKARAARAGLRFEEPFVVATVGNVGPTKGQDMLLAAAVKVLAEFPRTEFWFMGRDTEALARLAGPLGILDRVRLMGHRRDVPELLSKAHLFVMPSLMEGIGTSLIEAQTAGVPAVATGVGGLPDVVEGGVTGLLVQPGDPEALAGGILALLRDPGRAQLMAAKAVERVEGMFSLDAVLARLEAFYERVLGGAGPGPAAP